MLNIYRTYENPKNLEEQLKRAEERYERTNDYDDYCEVQELKDRINFAYQDEEFEENERAYSEFLGEY